MNKAGFVCIDENIQQEDPAGGVAASRMLFARLSEQYSLFDLHLFLEHKFEAVYGNPVSSSMNASSKKQLSKPGEVIVSDTELIREIFAIKTIPSETMLQFALSFWIRHSIVRLNALFVLKRCGNDLEKQLRDFQQFCGFSVTDFEIMPVYFASFSAKGIHLYRENGLCHYVDVYESFRCHEKTEPGNDYCNMHQSEMPFHLQSNDRLAKLFQYYGNLDNFNDADEQQLIDQCNQFLRKLKTYFESQKQSDQFLEALSFYSYQSNSDLIKSGLQELQSRFRKKAMIHHPDQSSSKDSTGWNQTYEFYNILKSVFI